MVSSGKYTGGQWALRSRLKYLIADMEAREGRRISQKEIAERTGLAEMTVSRWMSPKPFGHIETDIVEAFCRYFNCDIGELVYFDRDIKPAANQ